jgi:hypothetical protein
MHNSILIFSYQSTNNNNNSSLQFVPQVQNSVYVMVPIALSFLMMFEKSRRADWESAEVFHKQYDPTLIPPQISEWIGTEFTFVV